MNVLTVSKVERDKFRFTECDNEKYENHIRVTMKDYTKSMERITEIRKYIDHHDLLLIEF